MSRYAQILVAFALLNLVIGVLIGLATRSVPEFFALQFAQLLGALQVVLYWSMWRGHVPETKIDHR